MSIYLEVLKTCRELASVARMLRLQPSDLDLPPDQFKELLLDAWDTMHVSTEDGVAWMAEWNEFMAQDWIEVGGVRVWRRLPEAQMMLPGFEAEGL